MKNIIKYSALILSLLLLFCSCNSAEPEIVPEYSSDVKGADLDGFEILWGWDTTDDVQYGFIPGTSFSDMALEREKQVEEEYNCKIEVEYTDRTYDNLRASVMSGIPYYDLMTGGTYVLVVDVRAGYLTGLSGLLDVENVEKWGTPNMLQSLLWEDDLYGVVPFAWPDLLYGGTGHLIVVNENLVSKLAQPDPREYVENFTWNWDKFEEILPLYTYQDAGRTIYAINSHDAYFAMNMFLSNGCTLSAYENGEVVCGAYTEAGRVALERAKEIYMETCVDYFYPDTGATNEYFFTGDVVMTVAWLSSMNSSEESFLYKMDNVGVLPFPTGPNATPGVYPTYHEGLPYATCIPINAKDAQATSIVLSAMYEPFDGYETKEDIIDHMAEQMFFDRRDAEIFANMVRNTEYGFFREGARWVIENVCMSSDTVTSILEANEDKYDQIVEDYMIHHYEGRVSVYGE